MDVGALTKLLADSPLPAVCALLVVAVLGLFTLLVKSYRDRATRLEQALESKLELAVRVVALMEKLAPFAPALTQVAHYVQAQQPRRRKSETGKHAVEPEEGP